MKKRLQSLRNRDTLKKLAVALVVLLVIFGIFYYLKTNNRISIEDSVISAPLTTVSPSTPGTLRELLVTEGQTVRKGDGLAVVGSETLRAFTDGVVVMTNRQIGGTVSGQTAIVQMVNLSQMRIDGTLDENKGLNYIKAGQPVAFTIDALPGQTFWGYVDQVGSTAHQTAAAFSISSERPTQKFDVYAHFDASSHPEIKNGMSAKMTVYTKE